MADRFQRQIEVRTFLQLHQSTVVFVLHGRFTVGSTAHSMLKILTLSFELTSLFLGPQVPFIQGLQSFNAVISAMFGKELQPQYADLLKAFAHSFLGPNEKFAVPFMPKLHVVLQHLEEFVALTGRPLLRVPRLTLSHQPPQP